MVKNINKRLSILNLKQDNVFSYFGTKRGFLRGESDALKRQCEKGYISAKKI